jgi:radical SAM superfamily enzyme YgiQ (UPF0313 family)
MKENHVVYKDQGGGIGFTKLGDVHKAKKRPILDMLYSVQICEDAGFSVDIHDDQYSPSSTMESFISKINNIKDYKYIFIRTSLPTIYNDIVVSKELKRMTDGLQKVCIFGPAVINNLNWFKKYPEAFDAVVTSEMTAVVKNLVLMDTNESMEGKLLSSLPGCYESIKGELVCSEPSPIQVDIKTLPFLPYHRSMFDDYDKYIISSQGCPIGCSYCPYIVSQGLKFRTRDTIKIVDEMEYYEKELGIQFVMFRDPNFGFNNSRVIDICSEIIRRGLTITWGCETVIATMKNEVIEMMGKANCISMSFGVESLSEEVLKNYDRPVKLAAQSKLTEKVNKCLSIGIETNGFFVVGLDGDTIKSVVLTPDFATSLKLDRTQFMTPNLYPGTPLNDYGISEGLITKEELGDAEKYFSVIGTHAKINYNLSHNFSLKQLRVLQFYCGRKWSNNNRNRKLYKMLVGSYLSLIKFILLNIRNDYVLSFTHKINHLVSR